MKRVLLDSAVIVLLVVGDAVWRLLSQGNSPIRNFVTLHITAIWITWVSIVAAMRATWAPIDELRISSGVVSLVEWAAILIGVHVFLCWLDTVWQPQDNFSTVLAFTAFTLLLPSVIISSIAYVLVSTVRARMHAMSRVAKRETGSYLNI